MAVTGYCVKCSDKAGREIKDAKEIEMKNEGKREVMAEDIQEVVEVEEVILEAEEALEGEVMEEARIGEVKVQDRLEQIIPEDQVCGEEGSYFFLFINSL